MFDFDFSKFIYLLGFSISLAFIAVLLADSLLEFYEQWKEKIERIKLLKIQPDIIRRLQERQTGVQRATWMKTWDEYIIPRLKRSGWNFSSEKYLVILLSGSLLGITIGYLTFKDILISLALCIVFVLMPLQFIDRFADRERNALCEQMPAAVLLFVTEFESNLNLRIALAEAAKGVKEPLRKYLEQCSRDLQAAHQPERAFLKLANALDFPYGRLWVQMLMAATSDTSVVKLMPQLAARTSAQKILTEKNNAQLSMMRNVGIMLNVAIIPGFLIVQFFFPGSWVFYNTVTGKVVVIVALSAIIAGLTLDRMLRRVDV